MRTLTYDAIHMSVAEKVSKGGTCDRAQVGCVIIDNNHFTVSRGYNDSIDKHVSCADEGHLMRDGHCIRTIHAEMNALLDALKNGRSVEGCIAYVTHRPCPECTKHLNQAGIKEIVYMHNYRESHLHKYFEDGMILTPFSG